MLYFICPNTASGSIHLLPLCLIPSSESNLSRACRLYWFNRWLTSIIRFPPSFKTTATQRATFASFCFIPGTFGDVSARCLVTFGSYTVHVLSHRTNVIILLGIVMETFGMERVGSYNEDAVLYGSNCTWWRLLSHSPAWTGNFLPNRNRSLPHRYSVNGYSGTGKSGKKVWGSVYR